MDDDRLCCLQDKISWAFLWSGLVWSRPVARTNDRSVERARRSSSANLIYSKYGADLRRKQGLVRTYFILLDVDPFILADGFLQRDNSSREGLNKAHPQ